MSFGLGGLRSCCVRPLALLSACVLTCVVGRPGCVGSSPRLSRSPPTPRRPRPPRPPPEGAPRRRRPGRVLAADDDRYARTAGRSRCRPRMRHRRSTAPLTTAMSSREYERRRHLQRLTRSGPRTDEGAQGTLEVGYQIGCGIDMSTSNGVSLTGTVGTEPVDRASSAPTSSRRSRTGSFPAVGDQRRRRRHRRSQARAHQRRPGDEEGVQGRQAVGHGRADSTSRSTAASASRSSARTRS